LPADRPKFRQSVPPGSGVRIALDRDLDGTYDGDEILTGKDPSDPDSR